MISAGIKRDGALLNGLKRIHVSSAQGISQAIVKLGIKLQFDFQRRASGGHLPSLRDRQLKNSISRQLAESKGRVRATVLPNFDSATTRGNRLAARENYVQLCNGSNKFYISNWR